MHRQAAGRGKALPAAALAFLLGACLAGWVGWRSGADFAALFTGRHLPLVTSPMPPLPAMPDAVALAGRLAAIEQRMDRMDLRLELASSNTARAEALLVAFAVRRVVERGAPLGYLADQLKLRFGDAQPDAVATIIAGAGGIVPLDRLAARLEELQSDTAPANQQTFWHRVSRELADMFVVRRNRPSASGEETRFENARIALSEGRIDDAISIVEHLSNSNEAASWIVAARRYRDVERALDLIDTTALLAPRQPPAVLASSSEPVS